MAISKMKKASVICLKKDKSEVLKQLQAFGNLEFINLQTIAKDENAYSFLKEEANDTLKKEIEDKLYRLKNILTSLEPFGEKESLIQSLRKPTTYMSYRELEESVLNSKWESKCEEVSTILKDIATLEESISKIESECAELMPWRGLDVSIEEMRSINKVSVFTGKFPSKYKDKCIADLNASNVDMNIYVVSEDSNSVFFVIVMDKSSKEDIIKILKNYEYELISLKINEKPVEILDRLNVELEQKEFSLNEEKRNLESKSSYISELKLCEEYYRNELVKCESAKNLLESRGTCILSGWIPAEEEESLKSYLYEATGDSCKLLIADVSDDEIDEVPTKLKNNALVKPFESITEMYSLPKYNGLDPTPMLAPFYAFFFGMMVGDLGYGILMIIATVLALKLFNLSESNKQFAKFFMYLGVTTSIWGLIYGAVFGDFIKMPALISQSEDIFTIMYMSIGFGVLQILVGLILKAIIMIKAKDYIGAICDVGIWLLTFTFIALFAITKNSIFMYLMIASMVAIVLTNGREAKGIGGKLGSGAYALYGITNYVGDLVSYTRLMALGIAGGSIASAMNLIIGCLPSPVIFIVGPLIFVAAHIFNLLLGLLGAYVHGCRLQYVEYFGKFYDGGGRAFEPFKTIDEQIKIKKSEEK